MSTHIYDPWSSRTRPLTLAEWDRPNQLIISQDLHDAIIDEADRVFKKAAKDAEQEKVERAIADLKVATSTDTRPAPVSTTSLWKRNKKLAIVAAVMFVAAGAAKVYKDLH
jgi:hypothetical protein